MRRHRLYRQGRVFGTCLGLHEEWTKQLLRLCGNRQSSASGLRGDLKQAAAILGKFDCDVGKPRKRVAVFTQDQKAARLGDALRKIQDDTMVLSKDGTFFGL